MKLRGRLIAAVVTCLGLLFLSGCSNDGADKPLPEVTEANCQHSMIEQMKPAARRKAFSAKCIRRGGVRPYKEKRF